MHRETQISDLRNYDLATILQKLNNEYISRPNDAEIYVLTQLKFNATTQIFTLEIRKFTLKHKILRYVQRNYVKYPVYNDREMNIKDKQELFINRKINTAYFLNNQLLNYELPYWLDMKICDVLNTKPIWFDELTTLTQASQTLTMWRKTPNQTYHFLSLPKLEKTDYKETPSKLWKHLLLTLPTLGVNWFFYVSKNKAEAHKLLNAANKKRNDATIARVNEKNAANKKQVDDFNAKKAQQIAFNENLIKSLEYKLFHQNTAPTSDEWLDLRKTLTNYHNQYDNVKGIYIIHNTTKNKHYVGQSKNIGKRIFRQHFNAIENDVKNIIFAKDWYNNDDFKFKVIIYGDKETNLDNLEKEYIFKYDAFNNGYNKTGGNN